MKAIVNTTDFKKAMSIVMPCIPKDHRHTFMTFVQGRVVDDMLILVGCDGFRLSEYRIPATDAEPGVFWINPKIKMFLPLLTITITTDEKMTHVDAGLCGYQFKNPSGEQLNVDALFSADRGEVKSICFNPSLMSETLKPLKNNAVRPCVRLEIGNPDKSIVLTLSADENYRGLVLPMRGGN